MKLKKNGMVIFLLSSFVCIKAAYAQVSNEEIQRFLNQEVTNKRTKGIVVGIIDTHGQHILSAGTLGDKSSKKPDGNTMFEIASVTKLFNTLLLADLAQKNVVDLNAPISTYLPSGVKTPKFNEKEITLLHLASHTSGLPRFPFNQFPEKALDSYTNNDLYYYLSKFQLKAASGEKFKYSNTGMGLIGHILSLQTKKSYDSLISQHICKELKLANTSFLPTKKQQQNVAKGHFGNGLASGHYFISESMKGAGGLFSSVNDLLKFVSLSVGLTKNSLSPAMQKTQEVVGSIGYELGYDAEIRYDFSMGWNIWTKNGKTVYWKDGTSFGFRSFICFDKEQQKGVVVLSNSFNPINDIGLHLIDSTYKLKPYEYVWDLNDELRTTFKQKGIKGTITKYHALKASGNKAYIFNEEVLHYLAKEVLQSKKTKEAIQLHQLNVSEYPNSTMPLESLGSLYLDLGMKNKALECYSKALKMRPENLHYEWVLSKIKK